MTIPDIWGSFLLSTPRSRSFPKQNAWLAITDGQPFPHIERSLVKLLPNGIELVLRFNELPAQFIFHKGRTAILTKITFRRSYSPDHFSFSESQFVRVTNNTGVFKQHLHIFPLSKECGFKASSMNKIGHGCFDQIKKTLRMKDGRI